jgi:type I site-specific restriction endonuclease
MPSTISLKRRPRWAEIRTSEFNRNAAEGVAVREFSLPNGPCDYLLFVGGKAAGVIEAKKAGATLSGVAEQAARYMVNLPDHLARWDDQLRFDYESTGEETYFRDMRDPKPRSRRVFAFHQPQTSTAATVKVGKRPLWMRPRPVGKPGLSGRESLEDRRYAEAMSMSNRLTVNLERFARSGIEL